MRLMLVKKKPELLGLNFAAIFQHLRKGIKAIRS